MVLCFRMYNVDIISLKNCCFGVIFGVIKVEERGRFGKSDYVVVDFIIVGM